MDVSAFVGISAGGVTVIGSGIGVGRWTSRWRKARRDKRESQELEDAYRRNEELEIRWAILGKPATDWAEATPGMRQVQKELADTMSEHRKEDARLFEEIWKKIRYHDELLGQSGGDNATGR